MGWTDYNCILAFSKDEKKILMCLRKKEPFRGKLNLVGGKREEGENSLDAAYRELFEETGIGCGQIELHHLMDMNYPFLDYQIEIYCGTLSVSEVSLREELNPLVWVDAEEDFTDMDRFAGAGNIWHIVQIAKMYRAQTVQKIRPEAAGGEDLTPEDFGYQEDAGDTPPSFSSPGESGEYGDAIDYITGLFRGNAGGHDLQHTLRVYHNAMMIARSLPGCDKHITALAALLHDADDHKLFGTVNNANARTFLEDRGEQPETIELICRAINEVSFSRNRGKRPSTPEGMAVQDADRLDALGAVGIARTFAYGGEHGRPLEDSIRHFHEKLLLLKEELNTDAARAMAQKRHTFLEQFLEEYRRETDGELP